MTLEQIVIELKSTAARASEQIGTTKWYLFGSALTNTEAAADIDVLVICNSHGAADAIRRFVDDSEFSRPLHLSILTEAEHSEIGPTLKHGHIQVF